MNSKFCPFSPRRAVFIVVVRCFLIIIGLSIGLSTSALAQLPSKKGGYVTLNDVKISRTIATQLSWHTAAIAWIGNESNNFWKPVEFLYIKNEGEMPLYFWGGQTGQMMTTADGLGYPVKPGEVYKADIGIYQQANKQIESIEANFKVWQGPYPANIGGSAKPLLIPQQAQVMNETQQMSDDLLARYKRIRQQNDTLRGAWQSLPAEARGNTAVREFDEITRLMEEAVETMKSFRDGANRLPQPAAPDIRQKIQQLNGLLSTAFSALRGRINGIQNVKSQPAIPPNSFTELMGQRYLSMRSGIDTYQLHARFEIRNGKLDYDEKFGQPLEAGGPNVIGPVNLDRRIVASIPLHLFDIDQCNAYESGMVVALTDKIRFMWDGVGQHQDALPMRLPQKLLQTVSKDTITEEFRRFIKEARGESSTPKPTNSLNVQQIKQQFSTTLEQMTQEMAGASNFKTVALPPQAAAIGNNDVTPNRKMSVVTKNGQIQLLVNGQPVDASGGAPVTIDGRLHVSLRQIGQALETAVNYNPATKQIMFMRDDIALSMTVGSKSAMLNGKTVLMDAPPRAMNGRMYVPLRFVSEAFGAVVGK